MSTPIVHALYLEYRHEKIDPAGEIRLRQALVFPSLVFSRSVTNEHPRKHWEHYQIFNPAEKSLSEGMPILKTWLVEFARQYEGSGYDATTTPFVVQVTEDEYQTGVVKGDLPRNVALRIERVKKALELPDPYQSRL